MPDKITQVNRDIRSEVTAKVGSLGKLNAGEVGVKTDVVAKNLFDKYPNTDRILIAQMMAATYCSLLRDSKTIKDSEKLNLWQQFSERVFKFESPSYTSPHQTPKRSRSPDHERSPAPTGSSNPNGAQSSSTENKSAGSALPPNPASQRWLNNSKTSPPERIEFRESGISMRLILVSGSYFGDDMPVGVPPYYISTQYMPKKVFREYAMNAAVRTAAPPASEDEQPICEIYLSDAKGLVNSLGVHLVTGTQWINAFEGKFIDPQGQVELIYERAGKDGSDDYLAEAVIDPPMANTYYSNRVSVHRFFGKAKGCMRIAVSLDELKQIGVISTNPLLKYGTATELAGGQPKSPSVLRDIANTGDSIATEVRRAKPFVEFDFPASGEKKQEFHVHVRPKLIQIIPNPTGVKEDDLPVDVQVVNGTVTVLKFGQEDGGGYIVLDTSQVPKGTPIRGEIVDYVEPNKSTNARSEQSK